MFEFDDAEEADNLKGTPDFIATFHSSELHSNDSVCVKYSQSHLEVEVPSTEGGKTFGHWEKLEEDVDYKSGNCRKSEKNSMCAVSEKLKSSVETLNISTDSCEQDMSDQDSESLITDYGLKPFSSQTNIPHHLACENNNASASHCDERNDSSPQLSFGEEFETTNSANSVKMKLVESFITCSNNDHVVHNTKLSTDSVKVTDINICDLLKSCKDKSGKFVINGMERFLSSGNHFDESSDIKPNESYESSDNNNTNNEAGTIQRYLLSDSTSDCSKIIYSECDYQSFSTAQDVQAEDSYLSADTVSLKSELANKPQTVNCYESSKISKKTCSSAIDSKFLNRIAENTHDIQKESNYSTEEATNEICYTLNHVKNEESEYEQSLEDYKFADDDYDDEYNQSICNNSEYKQLSAEIESCYKQSGDEDAMAIYKQTTSKKILSSYKQHTSEYADDMDTEILDEDDVPCVSISPNVYQSYEEDSMTAHYQVAALVSAATHYGTSDCHTAAWNPASSSNNSDSSDALSSSQIPNSQTYTITQNTVTEAAISSAKGQTTTSTCSSASSSTRPSEDDHKAALCTGDQTFKPAVARQPTMVPFMPAGCSLPYVTCINPSMYAGTAMVQGLGGPTVMTSSSVHIAQHPGGATIMQHQSMSTGLNGGLAQATVMQQQAMSSGVQATAMLQHRTLANGGQTMLVQQRTMTTGLGGLSQQTVVQQRLAPRSNIAQAAMFHANAMRHRPLTAQQASMMQQRGIRIFPARMMGSPLMQSQTLGNPTLIRGGTPNPAAFIGHGLVRGANHGAIMQHLVRQRYLGGPVMPARGMQMMAGRPIRLVNK